MVKLGQNDFEELKRQGYTEGEIHSAMKEIEQEELSKSYGNTQILKSRDPRQNSQISSFSSRQNEDIVRWQLELNDILERAEHILKGDIPTFQDGHIIWDVNPNPDENSINTLGVNETMKVLAMYVNRNTILSDYNNDEIDVKVYDFGREINNLFFMRSEDFGMTDEEKKKSYPIIIREMVDIVHSAYKRALNGAEKRSLREMINVSQSTSTNAQLGGGVTVNAQGTPQQQRGLLNPMRYVKGKYV